MRRMGNSEDTRRRGAEGEELDRKNIKNTTTAR